MPRQYLAARHPDLVDCMLVGENALSLVAEFGVRGQTLLRCKFQAPADAGLKAGVTSLES